MDRKWIEKADVLVEALPYIRRFSGCTLVIKYGGHAMVDPALAASFAVSVVLLRYIGLKPVVVHGGGPQIARALEAKGIASSFVDGLRVTDDAAMEVVSSVLGGEINRQLAARIDEAGGRARALAGSEGGWLEVRPRRPELGRVGEVVNVDTTPLCAAMEAGCIPVVAPLGVDAKGLTYNVNADEAAGAVAQALAAEKLILLTDVEGVADSDGRLLSELDGAQARKLVDEGVIFGGMIPKVACCLSALAGGVSRTHIVDGRVSHALLLEVFTDEGVGTLIVP